jgi:carboxypeptidase family protein/TonB-dependent receptor-like protein
MRGLTLLLTICFIFLVGNAQQQPSGAVRGKAVDALGALVGGASVTIINANGTPRTTQTNRDGAFTLNNLAPGRYTVRATAPGFAPYENSEVEVSAGQITSLDVMLVVTVNEQVTVENNQAVNTDPEANASATVLRESDIEALPDNAADLAAALQALAGPAAGPSGGEVYIDGFSGGRLPPRDTIREIRINQNPFSSEYDRLGFGRIEIFTKPGTDKYRGEMEVEFEDESLNSRNPFAPNKAAFQVRTVSGNFGGPIIKNRASFFVDVDHEHADNNTVINALILDPALNITPFQLAVLVPSRDIEFSPRVDLKLNDDHTLVGRYSFSSSETKRTGFGGFELLSRVFATRDSDHTFRLTETAVVNASTVNEARGQYIRRRSSSESTNNSPTIRVLDAFTAGGANVGSAFSNEDRLEFQNTTSFLHGTHSVKVGARLRHVRLVDSSPSNFSGTFTFTTLDQYRATILNLPGAFPAQFSIAGGNPKAAIKQTDLGLFLQDDWRVNPQLTISLGLRYERQTNISSNFNLAPRFGFAFAPGAGGKNRPKTVFRGGFGVFYDRFGESLSLQASRFDGVNQQQFIVTDPTILDPIIFTQSSVANVPTVAALTAFAQPQTTRVVSPELQAPFTIQTAFGIERQLPHKTSLSVTYVSAQTRHLLRSRNIHAPAGGVRPFPNTGNIFQYESTGQFNQNQLILNLRSNLSESVSLFSNYAFGGAKSDTDSPGTFPANSYDLVGEYGRAALDIRHRFVIGGNLTAPFGFSFGPFITFRTGAPFNITTGTDQNGDTLFTERPAFATNASESGILSTKLGTLDPTPEPGDTIIPRNYGRGPEFFIVNLRATKEFGFGGGEKKSVQGQGGGGGGGRGGINSPFGGGGAQRGGDEDESKYRLEFTAQIRNLFNHTNRGLPVGNLRSALAGESLSLAGGFGFGGGGGSQAGNRRIELAVQFSF